MKEISLPSGAKLRLHEAPIEKSHELYQAVLAEVGEVEFKVSKEIENFGVQELLKNILCKGFSSKRVHAAATACFEKCLYNDEKLSMGTFEAAERRQDFTPALTAVVEENIAPFAKGLWSVFESYHGLAQSTQFQQ